MGSNAKLLRDDKRHERDLLTDEATTKVRLVSEGQLASAGVVKAGDDSGLSALLRDKSVRDKRNAFEEFVGVAGVRVSKQARRRIERHVGAAGQAGSSPDARAGQEVPRQPRTSWRRSSWRSAVTAAGKAAARAARAGAGAVVDATAAVAAGAPGIAAMGYRADDEGANPDELARIVSAYRRNRARREASRGERRVDHAAAGGPDVATEGGEPKRAGARGLDRAAEAERRVAGRRRAGAQPRRKHELDTATSDIRTERVPAGSAKAAAESAKPAAAASGAKPLPRRMRAQGRAAFAATAQAGALLAMGYRSDDDGADPGQVASAARNLRQYSDAGKGRAAAASRAERGLMGAGERKPSAGARDVRKRRAQAMWRERTRRAKAAKSAIAQAGARKAAAAGAEVAATRAVAAPVRAAVLAPIAPIAGVAGFVTMAALFVILAFAALVGTAWNAFETPYGNGGEQLARWAIGEYEAGPHAGGQKYWSHCGFGGRVEWCSCFVKTGWDECGFNESLGSPAGAAMANSWISWVKNDPSKGQLIKNGSGYSPKPGDIAVIGEPNGASTHVGIVVSEADERGQFHCIEGNHGDAIGSTYYFPGQTWDWVFRPNYPSFGGVEPGFADAEISFDEFMTRGVVYGTGEAAGYKYTYYSERVLPGGGLNIPGRHLAGGYVCDGDGYIVLACPAGGKWNKGDTLKTPFGAGKFYDFCPEGNIDVYVH